jgi:Tol biopolymer transport system component
VISPDGRTVAVAAVDSLGTAHVWVRPSGQFDYRRIEGTEGDIFLFWSPDSRSIGFFSKGALQRVSVEDGTIERIAGNVGAQRGGCWGANGRILYTPGSNAGIWSVPAEGGTPVPVTRLDTTLVDASHRFPVWLPDGRHFLFALWSNNARVLEAAGGIYLASVDGGEPRRLLSDAGSFVLLRSGHLLVRRGRNLVAVPFDTRSFRVSGPAVPVAEEVGFSANSGALLASASDRGDIAFAAQEALPATELAWVDRAGRRGDGLGARAGFESIRLSPDESHVAGVVSDATGMSQIWTADLTRRTVSRLTRDENDSYSPMWSPDGSRIVFSNSDTGTGDLYSQLAAGTRPKELLWTARPVDTELTDWSADGRWLIFDGTPRRGAPNTQVWAYDTARDSAVALLAAEFSQSQACLSKDGRWLAYISNESGRDEVYVRSFPDLERKWQASTAGGSNPHWRRDGRELVFGAPAGGELALMAVELAPSGSGLSFGEPRRLLTLPADVLGLSPAADHSRFLVLYQPAATSLPVMRVMLGWKPEARR